jgi:hypothetical protein
MFQKSHTPDLDSKIESTDDLLVHLASQLEPDGGMPGQSAPERAARSIAALLAFVASGHTLTSGAFRSHVARLVQYLKSTGEVPDRKILDVAIRAAGTGKVPPGDWLAMARTSSVPWRQVEKALTL